MHEIAGFLLAQATTVAPEPTTSVGIPWGSWIVSALNVAQPVVLLALSGVTTYVMAAFVPPWIRAFAGDAAQRRINQVLEHAVLSAIAQTKAAVQGQRSSVPVGSEILARAAQYAVDQAPDLVGHAAKGQTDNLLKMVLARMEKLGVAPEHFDVAEVKDTFPVDINKAFGK
jgi:hypothetical protein